MICTSQHSQHAGTSTILPKSKQKKFLSKSNFKILHDLDIKKLNFRSLKINEHHFAWHLFWYLISSKWSWFQASYWPFNLQKIQMKFLQLWHHQGCVIIFSPFIVETSQSDRWIFYWECLRKSLHKTEQNARPIAENGELWATDIVNVCLQVSW